MSSLMTSPLRTLRATRRSLVSETFTLYIQYLPYSFLIGAQHTFTVTDKYKPKRTLKNWGKPCIWLNNKDPRDETQDQTVKDWLNANCIFVNLNHRLYLPEPVIPPMFAPRPAPPPPSTPLFLPGTIKVPPPPVTPLSYLTPSPFHPPNVPQSPSDISMFTEAGTSAGNITINSQTNYLEDFGPFNYRYQHNLPM